jgi:hypothetical protein
MKTRIIFALTITVAVNAFAQESLTNILTALAHRSSQHFGTVRYPDGKPAAGVQVIFYPGTVYSDEDYNYHDAITDKDGHYEIVPPKKVSGFYWGPVYTTNCIMARDFEKNLASVQAFSVNTSNVDLTLQPAIALSGSVKNAEGVPISGAELTLGFAPANYGPELRPPFKANEQGQFSVSTLPQGIAYRISAIKAKGYGSSTVWIQAENTKTNHCGFPTLVLKHADRKLAGQVLDINGQPLAGVDLKFYSDGEPGQPENLVAKSDSEGKFVFDEVCEGKVMISALWTDPATKLFSQIGEVRSIEADDTNIVIRLHAFNK